MTKVLLVGSGGREHALAWKLARESPGIEIVAAPGNPGMAELARCVPVAPTDVERLVALAEHERPDFTIVGPEAPLALGVVDRFVERGLPIFGPTKRAAEIETSKAFAKKLMIDAGVPTAAAARHTEPGAAKRAAREFGAPVVVKASGLAAGKGVIVCQTLDEADRAIDFMLKDEGFGAAGAEILVEEFMEGEELSIFGITDGSDVVVLPAAQDHKRLLEGDEGPNTGGMGAFVADLEEWPEAARAWATVADSIMRPTLRALRDGGRPFRGLLYAGLMLTRSGPKVVEFNCRFGDPETQAILPAVTFRPGLLELMHAVAVGDRLPRDIGATVEGGAVTTVLASRGYPDAPTTGDPITLPQISEPGVHVFHAGTTRDGAGTLLTAGGRVLAVTAVADSFDEARLLSRRYAEQIDFAGKQFRRDIGWREVARRARAT